MSDKIENKNMTSNAGMRVMKSRDISRLRTSAKIGRGAGMVLTYAFLILIAIIVLFPFYWMIISSLKTLDEYKLSVPTLFPETIVFGNYA
ncbi:MAG: hypothetical protein II297_08980, partial [Clostridia bacterium]|nr:hypothetical protein [Clostridia bacterium]